MLGFARIIVSLVMGLIEILLSLRFIFKFINANSHSSFVGTVYDLTDPIVAPFADILPDMILGSFVLDFQTAITLVIFAVVGALLVTAFGRKAV